MASTRSSPRWADRIDRAGRSPGASGGTLAPGNAGKLTGRFLSHFLSKPLTLLSPRCPLGSASKINHLAMDFDGSFSPCPTDIQYHVLANTGLSRLRPCRAPVVPLMPAEGAKVVPLRVWRPSSRRRRAGHSVLGTVGMARARKVRPRRVRSPFSARSPRTEDAALATSLQYLKFEFLAGDDYWCRCLAGQPSVDDFKASAWRNLR